MRTIFRLFAAATTLFLLTGCATTTVDPATTKNNALMIKNKMDSISIGMSRTDVEMTLGPVVEKSTTISANMTIETWNYYRVDLINNLVPKDQQWALGAATGLFHPGPEGPCLIVTFNNGYVSMITK